MKAPTQARAVRTKQRIIIAAAEAVNELTFEKASLVDIAGRAGVTTGAFYAHFNSREDLAHAVIEAQSAYSQSKALAILSQDLPTLEILLGVSAEFTYDILQDPLVRAGARLTSGDNAAMKSFFALLQKNTLNRRSWTTREQLPPAIVTWIERTYHRRRRQPRLGHLTPIEFETIMNRTVAPAARLLPVTYPCSSPDGTPINRTD